MLRWVGGWVPVSPCLTSLKTSLRRPKLQHLLVEETVPQAVVSFLAGSVFCPGTQEAGSHPVGGTLGEKRWSLGEKVGAEKMSGRPGNGISRRWWLRLNPGTGSAWDPPAPSCLLNTPSLILRLPAHCCVILFLCVGRWTHGGSWCEGSQLGNREVAVRERNSYKAGLLALEKQM